MAFILPKKKDKIKVKIKKGGLRIDRNGDSPSKGGQSTVHEGISTTETTKEPGFRAGGGPAVLAEKGAGGRRGGAGRGEPG